MRLGPAGEILRLGERAAHLATGQALMLSVREFELLVAMASQIGVVMTRAQLYERVGGGELCTGNRSVDVYVSKLRAKLAAAIPDRGFIHTRPGFGYCFQPQPALARGPRRSPRSRLAAS